MKIFAKKEIMSIILIIAPFLLGMNFVTIKIAEAHEDGATQFTTENTLGPILAFIIIIVALVVARRIKNNYPQKQNNYDK